MSGAAAAVKKKKKRPKQPPVELGFAEFQEPDDDEADHRHSAFSSHHLQSQFFPSKIGGAPSWLALDPLPAPSDLLCRSCQLPCAFLMQVYAPVSSRDGAFHRTLFVFICLDPQCYKPSCSKPIIVFRSQLARSNPFYGFEPLDPDFFDPVSDAGSVKTVWDYTTLCAVCGCKGSLLCGRCRSIYYCSKEHQELNWKRRHKITCQRKKKIDTSDDQADPQNETGASTEEVGSAGEPLPIAKVVKLARSTGEADEIALAVSPEQSDTSRSRSGTVGTTVHLPSAETPLAHSVMDVTDKQQVSDPNAAPAYPGVRIQKVWDRNDGNIFLFPEMELVTEPEVCPQDKQVEGPPATEEERPEAERVADFEKYMREHKDLNLTTKKDNLDALEELSVKQDKAFKEFSRRIAWNPEQVIRYQRKGKPLLANSSFSLGAGEEAVNKGAKPDSDSTITVPPCCNCGSPRVFEFQVMPHLLSLLGVDAVGESIDWATLLVYTCEQSCTPPARQAYLAEYIVKQDFV